VGKKWLVTFSEPKTKSLTITNKRQTNNSDVYINGKVVEQVASHTYLGLHFSNNLRWQKHIHELSLKGRKRLNLMQPFKFKLNRKSLEIMYKTFVLSTMTYACVVWGGAFDCDIQLLERVHLDGLRIICGATARSNTSNIFVETQSLTIGTIIENAKLCMLYKISKGMAPNDLCDLLPPANSQDTKYNLRNNNNLTIPYCRLETFKRSFFPSAIRLWNALKNETRLASSISAFKQMLHVKRDNFDSQILYFYGERWPSVHHSRLRIGCSKLNYDLCCKLHVIDNPACRCGAQNENASHFFLHCPLLNDLRLNLKDIVEKHSTFNIKMLLFGDKGLSMEINQSVFKAVHEFIVLSERFT